MPNTSCAATDHVGAVRKDDEEDSARKNCVFCRIVDGRSAGEDKIVHETERLMVFRDKTPAASSHLQIVPRKHIDNLSALQRSEADHALVLEMLETGREVLERLHPGAQLRFGFHRPPFNSVLHLHMHGLALPFLPDAPKWKYQSWTPWWLPAEDALEMLRPTEGDAADEPPRQAAAQTGLEPEARETRA